MKREMVILAAAVLLGIAAILLNQLWAQRKTDELTSKIQDQIDVVAIKQRVESGTVLDGAAITSYKIPKAFAHPLVVSWDDRASVIGRRVHQTLQAEQPLLWNDLVGSTRRSVGDAILPGWGVVTVPIDLVGGVSGLITPGARVDLYGIFRELPGYEALASPPAANAEGRSTGELRDLMGLIDQMQVRQGASKDRFFVHSVASNLGVFAVGTRTQLDMGGEDVGGAYATISFAVPQGMQVALIMASQKAQREGGKLVCVLRSNVATEESSDEAKPFTSDDFMKIVHDAARLETK